MQTIEDWSSRLAAAMARAVREFVATTGFAAEVAVFDVGCFPWQGTIELSLLTRAALVAEPRLLGRSEIAAWPHYHFAADLPAWAVAHELGAEMKAVYLQAEGPARAEATAAFLRACVRATEHADVVAALQALRRSPAFRVQVFHPDTGHDFAAFDSFD